MTHAAKAQTHFADHRFAHRPEIELLILDQRANLRRRAGKEHVQGARERVKLEIIMHRQHIGHMIIMQMTEHNRVQMNIRHQLRQMREHACSAVEQNARFAAVAFHQIPRTRAAGCGKRPVVSKNRQSHQPIAPLYFKKSYLLYQQLRKM